MERETGISMETEVLRERFAKGIYEEIQPLRQWVCWKAEEVNGKLKKAPYSPRTGHRAGSTLPETWGYLPQALARMQYNRFDGVGFVLTESDPYVFVDVDERQENGEVTSEIGKQLFSELDTITEFSPRKGLHFLAKVDRPVQAVKTDIEIYFSGRYMTITADLVPNSPLVIANRQNVIEQLIAHHASREKARKPHEPSEATIEPQERSIDPRDWHQLPPNRFDEGQQEKWTDEELLKNARNAGNGKAFTALFDYGHLAQFGGDKSRADMQLVKYLLYWTNGNKVQTNRLFEQSALMRPKWRDRKNAGGAGHSYGEMTIHNAIYYKEQKQKDLQERNK